MENKFQNIYFYNLSQINLPSSLNLELSKIYSSPYKNFSILIEDNKILYIGKNISQENSNDYIFEEISQNINSNQKYIECDFTQNNIYLITKDKNEVYISDYNFPHTLCPLPGILQKKKIKSVSCGINSSIFLTYGGMVYSNTDQEKESQKLMNDLLEYNISQVYAGGNHFF